MNGLTNLENQAVDYASEKAGEYLESIGKFSLDTMTGDEWLDLVRTIFLCGHYKIQELSGDGEVPF